MHTGNERAANVFDSGCLYTCRQINPVLMAAFVAAGFVAKPDPYFSSTHRLGKSIHLHKKVEFIEFEASGAWRHSVRSSCLPTGIALSIEANETFL